MAGRIALGLLTIILMAAIAAVPVVSNTTYSLYLMSQNEDRFWNYDFESGGIGRPDKVDQAVTIVFCGNANKQKVENGLSPQFPAAGTLMYHQLDDGNGLVNDFNGGRKSAWGDADTWHFRMYAAGGSYMQNSSWGKYVLSTTHRDWKNCPDDYDFGWNEDCENYICSIARGITGWTVYEDVLWFANRDWPFRKDGKQYWQCDGWASKIVVP